MQKKIYTKKSEKVGDFLIGLLVIPFLLVFVNSVGLVPRLVDISQVFFVALNLAVLVFAVYVGVKRKFIGIGLLFAFVVIPLIAAGTCLLIYRVGG